MGIDDKSGNRSWLLDSSTDPDSVAKYYDEWASRYDEDLRTWEYRSPDEAARWLADYAQPSAKVLDAGCGTGLSGQALAALGFHDTVGIDISGESLRVAVERGVYVAAQQVNLQALPLPFPDNMFDALICVGVLTYIDDTVGTLREFCRLVRPGGHIVFTCRDDLYRDRDYASLLTELGEGGQWRLLNQSPPSPYLPRNEDFAESIQVLYFVFEVL